MFNVPVKHAALYLIIRAHGSVIGRWGAHEACVCSGKLLNCFCVYIKDHATENISPSSRLCAQRIWSCAEEEAWVTWKSRDHKLWHQFVWEWIKLELNVLYFIPPFSLCEIFLAIFAMDGLLNKATINSQAALGSGTECYLIIHTKEMKSHLLSFNYDNWWTTNNFFFCTKTKTNQKKSTTDTTNFLQTPAYCNTFTTSPNNNTVDFWISHSLFCSVFLSSAQTFVSH